MKKKIGIKRKHRSNMEERVEYLPKKSEDGNNNCHPSAEQEKDILQNKERIKIIEKHQTKNETKILSQKDPLDGKLPNQEELFSLKSRETENFNNNVDTFLDNRRKRGFDKCSKRILKLITYLIMLLSSFTLGFCIGYVKSDDFKSSIYGTNLLKTSSIVLMVYSIILIIISTSEFICMKNPKVYDKLIFTGLSVYMTLFIVTMVTTAIYIHEVNSNVQKNMKNILINNYGKDPNHSVNKQWDELQQTYECCGVDNNSTTIYQTTAWFEPYSHLECYKAKYVPPSCCTNPANIRELENCQAHCSGPPKIDHGDENPYLFNHGCYPKIKAYLLRMAYTFIILNSLSVVSLLFKTSYLFYLIKYKN